MPRRRQRGLTIQDALRIGLDAATPCASRNSDDSASYLLSIFAYATQAPQMSHKMLPVTFARPYALLSRYATAFTLRSDDSRRRFLLALDAARRGLLRFRGIAFCQLLTAHSLRIAIEAAISAFLGLA